MLASAKSKHRITTCILFKGQSVLNILFFSKLFTTLQAVGQKLADTIKSGHSVIVELDFKESMAHPDDRYTNLYQHERQDGLQLTGTIGKPIDLKKHKSC